jgi:hypothetical protein
MAVSANLNFSWIVSSPLATSYVDLDRADSYFLQRVNSDDWPASLTDDQKAIALINGTRAIEAYPGISDRKFKNFNSDQALYFPYREVLNYSGSIGSATTTSFTDVTLIDVDNQPDDVWNFGSVKITDGTGQGQIREVSDFDSTTGVITIAVAWTTNPDSTSSYQLIAKIPDEIIRACCEIAYLYVPDATTLVIDSSSPRDELKLDDVEQFRVGNHSEKFKSSATVNGYRIPPVAAAILNKWRSFFA